MLHNQFRPTFYKQDWENYGNGQKIDVMASTLKQVAKGVEKLTMDIERLEKSREFTQLDQESSQDYIDNANIWSGQLDELSSKIQDMFPSDHPLTLSELNQAQLDHVHENLTKVEKEMRDRLLGQELLRQVKPGMENLFQELIQVHETQPYFLSRVFKILLECDSDYKRNAMLFAMEQVVEQSISFNVGSKDQCSLN